MSAKIAGAPKTQKTISPLWPWWLTTAATLDVVFNVDEERVTNASEAMRKPLSFYGTSICFALLQPDRRAAFGLGPIDNDELAALNNLLYGDCKTEDDFNKRHASLEAAQAEWDAKLYLTLRGARAGRT